MPIVKRILIAPHAIAGNERRFLALHVMGQLVLHKGGGGDESETVGHVNELLTSDLGEVTFCHFQAPLYAIILLVLIRIEPDKVFRTVVPNVTIQMVALLPFLGFAMKGAADQSTDKASIYLRIIRMTIGNTLEALPAIYRPFTSSLAVD